MDNKKQKNWEGMEFNKVLVVGLGQLGLPVAKYVKQRGFDTYGYDLSPKVLEIAVKKAGIKKAVNFTDFDVFLLCVSTHKPGDMGGFKILTRYDRNFSGSIRFR